MKKLLTILLSLTLLFSMTACGGDDDNNTENLGDWWIIQEIDLSEGIPLLVRFELHDGDDYATSYDLNGQEVGTIGVSYDGDRITLDLGITAAEFITDGKYLYNPDTEEIEFYRSDDPEFIEQKGYDGTWYINGDTSSTNVLKINGNSYELNTDFEQKSGTFEYGPSIHIVGQGHEVSSLPSLEAEFPGPEFYPVMDGKVLYGQDFMDYICYINENYVNDETALMYARMTDVLNSQWMAYTEDSRVMLTVFPYYFQIMTYAVDENGIENPNPELGAWEGTWEFDVANNQVIFSYFDGNQDSFALAEDMIEIELDAVNFIFARY